MTQAVLQVEHLEKYYKIRYDRRDSYSTLTGTLAESGKEIFRTLLHPIREIQRRNAVEIFKALDDISFEVNPGDRVGSIGRSGAWKSTLLKQPSRITKPDAGKITLRRRVASLLEVRTVFHPELTGGENIYLNGSILGMKHVKIRRKFDKIVDFSGVKAFLDTPVKRYSSGMYVRLAFAVAAHLEPEILLVDKVLAIDNMEFQKKCLGKMDDFSRTEGQTILFVSHNMEAIAALCNRGLVLDQEILRTDSNIDNAIQDYEGSFQSAFSSCPAELKNFPRPRPETLKSNALFERFTVLRKPAPVFETGESMLFELELSYQAPASDILFHLVTRNGTDHTPVTMMCTETPLPLFQKKTYTFVFTADISKLVLGNYTLSFLLYTQTLPKEQHDEDLLFNAFHFKEEPIPGYNHGCERKNAWWGNINLGQLKILEETPNG